MYIYNACYVNLLGVNVNIIKGSTEAYLVASKEVVPSTTYSNKSQQIAGNKFCDKVEILLNDTNK